MCQYLAIFPKQVSDNKEHVLEINLVLGYLKVSILLIGNLPHFAVNIGVGLKIRTLVCILIVGYLLKQSVN